MRLVRLVRLVKLYRQYESNKEKQEGADIVDDTSNEVTESRVGQRLSGMLRSQSCTAENLFFRSDDQKGDHRRVGNALYLAIV